MQSQFQRDEDRLFHGDLKSANVLLAGPDETASLELATIKIADFGESHTADEEGRRKGTVPYMAPEVWTKHYERMPQYNWMNADVWSFGVVCWELIWKCVSNAYCTPVDGYKEVGMDSAGSLESGLLKGR